MNNKPILVGFAIILLMFIEVGYVFSLVEEQNRVRQAEATADTQKAQMQKTEAKVVSIATGQKSP